MLWLFTLCLPGVLWAANRLPGGEKAFWESSTPIAKSERVPNAGAKVRCWGFANFMIKEVDHEASVVWSAVINIYDNFLAGIYVGDFDVRT